MGKIITRWPAIARIVLVLVAMTIAGPAMADPPAGEEPTPPTDAQAAPAPGYTGQWVMTDEYGWVWMPDGSEYVYTPADDDAVPSVYVYYPAYGWTWVVAPWLRGVHGRPRFHAPVRSSRVVTGRSRTPPARRR